MSKPLRVLLVEDSEDDAALLLRELKRGGYEPAWERVETAAAMKAALDRGEWDIVIADYALPQFSAPAALLVLREKGLDLPFIIVSGSIGEEVAVDGMKAGANDYVMKDKPARLAPAIERELREADGRRARRAAEEARSRLAAILEVTTDFVATADAGGGLLYVNSAGRHMLGLGEDEDLSRLTLADCHPEWVRGLLNDGIPSAIEGGVWSGETAILSRSGREIPVSQVILAHRTRTGAVEYLSTIARNMTERKWAEEALRESEQRYRELFENANDMIFTLDLNGAFTSINKAGERITGYTRQEAIALNIVQLVVREDALEARRLLDIDLMEAGPLTCDLKLAAKDGRRVQFEISSRLIYKEGKPYAIQGVARDVTEREELEEQLRQSQKMEAIGRLAGGVAHDFNNLLTAIIGYSQLLLRRFDHDDPLRAEAEGIIRAGQHAASLTRQLLAFSRRQVLKPIVMNLNGVVAEMDKMLRRLIGEHIELLTRVEPALGRVKADPGQIEQVVMNLALNARDAMPTGGKLTIRTANIELTDSYPRNRIDAKSRQYVMLSVADTGCGIDAETRSHIFEPFFTTKGEGEGTGLGLATVYAIVDQSGGHIDVLSEPGVGTTFKIYLPRVQEKARALPAREQFDYLPEGTETVLLVEDEPVVRDLAAIVLRNQGYTVLEAPDGEEALKMAMRFADKKIDLLLTDVVMPRIGGKELAESIRSIRPETKILFASGYTNEAILRQSELDSKAEFIQKPFTPGTLARKVREVLDQ
jgi:PAS domain S-box-containing protein